MAPTGKPRGRPRKAYVAVPCASQLLSQVRQAVEESGVTIPQLVEGSKLTQSTIYTLLHESTGEQLLTLEALCAALKLNSLNIN